MMCMIIVKPSYGLFLMSKFISYPTAKHVIFFFGPDFASLVLYCSYAINVTLNTKMKSHNNYKKKLFRPNAVH